MVDHDNDIIDRRLENSDNEYYECSDDTMSACDDDIFMEVPSNDEDLWTSLNHEERSAYS
jgi:hypothetical protein